MDGLFEGLQVTDFHGDIHRNIVSPRKSQNLYDDLTDSPEGWQAAIDLEMSAKPRMYISNQPVIHRPFEEAVYNEAIDYPFKHWSKTRYSDGSFGVWYGADSLETSVHETAYHWRKNFLEDAGWHNMEGVITERKVYLVRCDAALLDFIPKLTAFPALIDSAPGAYYLTHPVGARMNHDGHPGLRSRSAHCAGDIYAIFNPKILSSPRPTCYLTYQIKAGSVIVERQPGVVLLRL